MAKIELSGEDMQLLSECINEQKDVPAELLTKLSPGFFDKLANDGRFDFKALDKFKIPTIEYAGKRPESVILAQAAITGGAAPLQIVRSFANGKNGDWKNLIVQGDNLQFLKTCYLNQDPLIKDKVKGKIKLIYIDPPFATKKDFLSSDGEQSYADKVDRSEFLEGLRERLIYLKEILADEGSIFIHLDDRMVHYVKIICDEIFGKQHFVNNICWCYEDIGGRESNFFKRKHDTILFYQNGNQRFFETERKRLAESTIKRFEKYFDKNGRITYRVLKQTNPGVFQKLKGIPEDLDEVWLDINAGPPLNDWWIDISPLKKGFGEYVNYITQKPEKLIARIIKCTTGDKDDIILDCFAGAGTTAAVAEKLERRWIVCDFGKQSIYTTQKRILNIASSKKLYNGRDERYDHPPKPFCVVSAGAYDFTRIMDLRKNQGAYITFVLGLFSIMREKVDFGKKYKLPNIYAEKNGDPVEVFPVWDDEYLRNIRIDEEYMEGIIDASGGKLKGDYYIVTPETCARIGDTTIKTAGKEKVNFKLLKFPYKVLEELSRHFQIEEQAASSADINRLISSVGFYFNDEVKVEVERKKGCIKITKFKTGILDKNGQRFKGLDGLAMVLVDLDYDGKIFDMDEAIYSKDIGDDGVINSSGLTKNTHVIAIDKHGNESKAVKVK